jgi:hypothetical protein
MAPAKQNISQWVQEREAKGFDHRRNCVVQEYFAASELIFVASFLQFEQLQHSKLLHTQGIDHLLGNG